MKKLSAVLILALALLSACGGKKEERFNYTMIKEKLDLTEEEISQFDEITDTYMQKAHENFEKNRGDREAAMKGLKAIFAEQDEKIKAILSEEQYAIYASEIKIEREGREKHNMKLIKQELALDSAQAVQFDLANEAFYTTLIDNHDNYHGKPEVYKKYYKELDVSRKDAFEKLMTEEQYNQYLRLSQKYKIGQSEH